MDAVEAMLKISKLKPSTESWAFITVCNIASDKQIQTLSEINKAVSMFVGVVLQNSNELGTMTNDDDDNDKDALNAIAMEKITNKKIITSGCLPLNYILVLRSLYKLAMNDRLRGEIYFKNRIKDQLKVILKNAKIDETECEFTLELLCQLSFNEVISQDIAKDKELVEYLGVKGQGRIGSLKETLLWNLKTSQSSINNLALSKTDGSKLSNDEHIMISYNSASRDLCIRVKDELETVGFKVTKRSYKQ